jgi:hypothetical protein
MGSQRYLAALYAILVAAPLASAGLAFAASPQTSQSRVEAVLENITNLSRPGQDGYATIWDGNKYVQCRRLADRGLRCEAAGTLMQSSLERVLTPDHVARLTVLGWRLDPSFGNYAQTFPADAALSLVADKILQVLGEAYDADVAAIEIESTWVRSEPCPPRNGPSQNLAGIVNNAPDMASTAVHACAYKPMANLGPSAPVNSIAELIEFYGAKVTAEIQRLRVNKQREVFTVFEAGIGYVQCEPETSPPAIYCEAQSTDSWEALASVLTPDRVKQLHDLGFTDPGRGPNYWKEYPLDQFDDAAIAHEVLTVLHDIYGYTGLPALKIVTEERGR